MFKFIFFLWQLFQQFIKLEDYAVKFIVEIASTLYALFRLPIYKEPFIGLDIKPPTV